MVEEGHIYIYGCCRTVITEDFSHQSQGVELYEVMSRRCHIPISSQLLLHKGKTVDPVKRLVDQGIVSGSNVFFIIKARGGGGNSTDKYSGKCDYTLSTIIKQNIFLFRDKQ